MKTTSVTIPLGKLFDGRTFEIPEIQRDYAWDPKKEVSNYSKICGNTTE